MPEIRTAFRLHRRIAAALLLGLALLVAGCGGDDEESGSDAVRAAAVSLQQAMDTASRAIDEVRGTRSSLERLDSRLQSPISQTSDVIVLLTPKSVEGDVERQLLSGARQQRSFLQFVGDAADADSQRSATSALARARAAGRRASSTYARIARENPELAGVLPASTTFNTGRLSDAIRSVNGSSGGGSGDKTSGGTTSGGTTSGGTTSGGTTGSGAASDCGDGVSVNAATSCPFGKNVADAYRATDGASTVDVFSPVTNKVYTMTCTGGAPVICRGGNNAVVYIR